MKRRRALALAWLRHGVERLGWPGLLGLALCLAGAAGWQVGLRPLEKESQALTERIAGLRAERAARPDALPAAERRELGRLPGGEALAPQVAAVFAAARRQQIEISQGEYALQREPGGQTARYRMSFPARGTYPALRAWTSGLLAAQPGLMLDELDLRRENIGSAIVEARVQFSMRLELAR